MPVKVRCSGCQKVLNAPDAARGKAVKCPQCETKVRIPAGPAAPGAKTAARKAAGGRPAAAGKRRPASKADSTDDIFARLDLDNLEDTRTRVCPKCAAVLEEDDVECPKCGVDPSTGQLSARVAKRRSRRGPDPGEFYGKAWTDSATFVKENLELVWRTGTYWTMFLVLWIVCLYMSAVYCEKDPPKFFWGALSTMSLLGVTGWYWHLSGEVISATMQKKKKLKGVQFDFLMTVALGLKAYVWNIFLILPVLPALVFPLAMIHMTQRYTYKAWVPYDMLRVFFRNPGPALYWLLMSFLVTLPAVLAAGLMVYFLFFGPILRWIIVAVFWVLEMIGQSVQPGPDGAPPELGLISQAVGGLVWLFFIISLIAPFAYMLAFPAVFMMRANGLLGWYNRERLELVQEQKAGVLAGFWPRYVAFMVDLLIIGVMFAVLGGIVLGAAWVLEKLMGELGAMAWSFGGLLVLIAVGVPSLYFVRSEAGPGQATIGMRSLGLVVVTLDGKPVTTQMAMTRYGGRLLSVLTLGIGFFMAWFTEKQQTLHDIMSKTQVVWRGDDESTTR